MIPVISTLDVHETSLIVQDCKIGGRYLQDTCDPIRRFGSRLKATEGKTGAVAARGVLVVGCDYPLDPIGFWVFWLFGVGPLLVDKGWSLPFVALPLLESHW